MKVKVKVSKKCVGRGKWSCWGLVGVEEGGRRLYNTVKKAQRKPLETFPWLEEEILQVSGSAAVFSPVPLAMSWLRVLTEFLSINEIDYLNGLSISLYPGPPPLRPYTYQPPFFLCVFSQLIFVLIRYYSLFFLRLTLHFEFI